MLILYRNLYYINDANHIDYGGLIQVSLGYTPVQGRLHTRYAPVRHSHGPIAGPTAVRLACIRPAASVHPEPGSNSSS